MNQLCKVCGEPAAGFHFGAFTCEGCKSFFGRTYNNLSQIHECKNGGSCVINKQNRTSCKACRLRKCLIVGMSKSGSRYGRRSNWFKIHCLLQEQASLSSQAPAFRTPATPTLQDGSLPFVATHLRDPFSGLESTITSVNDIPSSTPSISVSSHSPTTVTGVNCGLTDIHRMPTTYSAGFPTSPLLHSNPRLHDGLVSGPPRTSQLPSPMESCRDQLLNIFQRTQGMDPLLVNHENESFEGSRRRNHDFESSLGPMAFLEWKRRLREATKNTDVEVLMERKTSSCSPVKNNIESPAGRKDDEGRRSLETIGKQRKSQSPENTASTTNKQILSKNGGEHEILSRGSKNISSPVLDKRILQECKDPEALMNEDDRLSFLRAPVTQPNSLSCGRLNPSLRFPGREDILYNPVNNNIFSFPPYHPLWQTMLPFSPFSKLYPPFCPPRLQSPIGLDPLKPPLFSLFDPPNPRVTLSETAKEDPLIKKRNLDAILQYQREVGSPCNNPTDSPSIAQSVRALVSLPQGTSIHSTPSSSASSEQPIDLTVRRKRKMDKSEIVYKPGDDIEEMESDTERDPKEEKTATEHMEIRVSEVPTSVLDQKFEVPLKVIKLETNSETLAV